MSLVTLGNSTTYLAMTDKYIPKVEFRIPISATNQFLKMLHYLIESILEFGGSIARNADFVVSVSRDMPYVDIPGKYPWFKDLPIKFRWIDEALFSELEYDGTGLDRFYVKSTADIVIMCDADILVTGCLDEIILKSFNEQKQFGFIGHYTPFCHHIDNHKSNKNWWDEVYKVAELPEPELSQSYTGYTELPENHKSDQSKSCPYYYNYGFIISPTIYVDKIALTYKQEIINVDSVLDTVYKSQIANSLSYSRHSVPSGTLSLNYNYPLHLNEDEFREENHSINEGNSAHDIKIFHYLGEGEFNKNDFLSSSSLNEALFRTNLSDSGTIFQQKLKTIHLNVEKKKSESCANLKLVIISGPRRSGTTLLNAICCSDQRANELGQEAQVLTRLVEAYKWAKTNFDSFGLSYFESKEALKRQYRELVNNFVRAMASHATHSYVLILKNPEFALVQTELGELLPDACYLSIFRNPKDQICSELEVIGRRNQKKIYATRELISSLCNSYNEYARPILDASKLRPGSIHFINYEDLVTDFTSSLSSINLFCGLHLNISPNECWERTSAHAGLHATPSASKKFGRPISKSSIGRFEAELPLAEQDFIDDFVCNNLPELYNSHDTLAPNNIGKKAMLNSLIVPDKYNRNAETVTAQGVENTGRLLIDLAMREMGLSTLRNADILDIGCGVRFTQTLINHSIPFSSYTGVEVDSTIVDFLQENVESKDQRFRFVHCDIYNGLYNTNGKIVLPLLDRLPVKGNYDVIWLFSVFTHLNIEDAKAMLRLLRKEIKPSGHLLFSVFIDQELDGFEDRLPETPLVNAYYGLKTMNDLIEGNGWRIERFQKRDYQLPIVDYYVCSPDS